MKRWALHLLANKGSLPVVIELNRLNEDDRSIDAIVVDVFRELDFPGAHATVSGRLDAGTLTILLDGLDEVNTSRRKKAVARIRDFIRNYSSCHVVITCRNATYHNELLEVVDQTLEVAEFEDDQVQAFLYAWSQNFPYGKSPHQLIAALRERPRILALVRRPLLLTILVFLYARDTFALPQSRAEFYELAVDVLLDQWKHEANVFKARHKKLLLQRLALWHLDGAASDKGDRRAIDAAAAILFTKKALPDLGLADDQADALLDEIVERSALLLSIDSGAKLMFPHLTLQEYFAAAELRENPIALVGRFDADRDAWREVVGLWCGLTNDATELLRNMFASDRVSALELVADAQVVDQALADQIIEYWLQHFADVDVDADRVARALGAVATGPTARPRRVFRSLSSVIATSDSPRTVRVAAAALALTNQSDAVPILGERYDDPEVAATMVKMGDLAVEWFRDAANSRGATRAVRRLGEIGTPSAARALASLLGNTRPTISREAALQLGALLRRPEIQNGLNELKAVFEWRASEELEFVWKPFGPSGSSANRVIGRVAWLIQNSSRNKPLPSLDARICIALIVNRLSDVRLVAPRVRLKPNLVSLLEGSPRRARLHVLPPVVHGKLPRLDPDARSLLMVLADPELAGDEIDDRRYELVSAILHGAGQSGIEWLFQSLNSLVALRLLITFLSAPKPTTSDWTQVLIPVEYTFETGWHFRLLTAATATLGLVALFRMSNRVGVDESGAWQLRALLVLTAAAIYFVRRGWGSAAKDPKPLRLLGICVALPLIVAFLIVVPLVAIRDRAWPRKDDLLDGATLALFAILDVLVVREIHGFVTTLASGLAAGAVYVILVALAILLIWRGYRVERAAANPLRMLDEDLHAVAG